MSSPQQIRERMIARDPFSLAEIRGSIACEGDLELWAAIRELIGHGWDLIHPEPGMQETCGFITRYLLRCVREDVQNDHIPSGYEAAHDLAACLKYWATKLPQTQPVLTDAAQKITEAYLKADAAERD